MKSAVFVVLTVFLSFLAHMLWPVAWDRFGCAPNFLLICTVYHGFSRGPGLGQGVGFVSGLALDALSADMFGASAILLSLVGYTSGMMQRIWDEEQPTAQMLLVFLSTMATRLGFLVLQGLFSDHAQHAGWLDWTVRPVVGALAAPIVFRLFHVLSRIALGGKGWHRVEQ